MMKKFYKIFLILIFLVFAAGFSFSEQARFNYENYSAKISYLPENFPGDAVFVRLSLKTENKKFIKNVIKSNEEEKIFTAEGNLDFIRSNESKKIGSSKFYVIKKGYDSDDKKKPQKSYKIDLLSGIPLSSFLKEGNYFAEISFSAFGQNPEKVAVPVEIKHKDFVSETIPLNPTNTSIKTNSTNKRWQQIEKLNKILGTTDESAVYDFSSYTPPTPITRRTSFFADRRIYAYSNGKSSTSLHYGIDFGVPKGNEVRSCAAGKVVMAEDRISTGYSVVIEHLPGLYSLYYHNSELKVKEGDIVQKGDLIAISGATGLATGPHVHWEMRLNMEAVSPDFFVSDFAFNQQ